MSTARRNGRRQGETKQSTKRCTLKQAKLLRRFGYDTVGMSPHDAQRAIAGLASIGWKEWGAPIDKEFLRIVRSK